MPSLRILALGDSYTIGEGVAPEARWPERLAAALRAGAGSSPRSEGPDVAPPEIIAVTGWTIDDLGRGIDEAAPEGPFDLVTLLIGVNDQYDGRRWAELRDGYAARLAEAVALAGGDASRVVCVSIPDWGVTPRGAADARGPHGIAAELDALNAAERELAEAAGAAWVDITPLSRGQGGAVVDDGLHPDAAAYAAWTERIVPAARRALGLDAEPAGG